MSEGRTAAPPAAPAFLVFGRRLGSSRAVRRFALHFGEMMLAMTAGMMLLAPLWTLLVPDLNDRPGPHTMTMAADMAIFMGLWMRIRGHDWRMITEMSAIMAAPFALLLLPYSAGWLSAGTLSMFGHTLMTVAMLALMLVRRGHYSQPQGWALPWRRNGRLASKSEVSKPRDSRLVDQVTCPSGSG